MGKANPDDRFLSPRENYKITGFDNTAKEEVLVRYQKSGDLSGAMESLGFSPSTVYRAMKADPAFKQAIREARVTMSDSLEGHMFVNAKQPKHFMDRIAWLRANGGEKWNPRAVVEHKKEAEGRLAALGKVIEAEVVADDTSNSSEDSEGGQS